MVLRSTKGGASTRARRVPGRFGKRMQDQGASAPPQSRSARSRIGRARKEGFERRLVGSTCRYSAKSQALGILVVEPDDEVALALEGAFEDAKFNVETAASWEQAELAMHGCQFDIVVLAWEGDQDERAWFMARLRRQTATSRFPLVIAAMREHDETLTEEARSHGANALAIKACSLADFVDAVRAVLIARDRRFG